MVLRAVAVLFEWKRRGDGENAGVYVLMLWWMLPRISDDDDNGVPEAFERRRYMNVVVHRARHLQLKDYIHSAVKGLQPFTRFNMFSRRLEKFRKKIKMRWEHLHDRS